MVRAFRMFRGRRSICSGISIRKCFVRLRSREYLYAACQMENERAKCEMWNFWCARKHRDRQLKRNKCQQLTLAHAHSRLMSAYNKWCITVNAIMAIHGKAARRRFARWTLRNANAAYSCRVTWRAQVTGTRALERCFCVCPCGWQSFSTTKTSRFNRLRAVCGNFGGGQGSRTEQKWMIKDYVTMPRRNTGT